MWYGPSKTCTGMIHDAAPKKKGLARGRPLHGSTDTLPYVRTGKSGRRASYGEAAGAGGPQGLPLVKPPYSEDAYHQHTGEIAWQTPNRPRPRSPFATHPARRRRNSRRRWTRLARVERSSPKTCSSMTYPDRDPPRKRRKASRVRQEIGDRCWASGACRRVRAVKPRPFGNGKQFIALTLPGDRCVSLSIQ